MTSNLQKHRILIVEDEISLRQALRDKFVREGFEVFEARDGEVGLSQALREQPDLILLDMMMPKMDGKTMLNLLRLNNEWSKQVPVLLLTNLGSDDRRVMKDITEDPHAEYLVKSNWPMSELVEKVRDTITHQQRIHL